MKVLKYIYIGMLVAGAGWAGQADWLPAPPDPVPSSHAELPKMVRIEAVVMELTDDNSNQLGFIYDYTQRIEHGHDANPNNDRPQGSITDALVQLPLLAPGFDATGQQLGMQLVGRLIDASEGYLVAQLQALLQERRARVLSKPTIITVDGKPARISTGRQFPYIKRVVNQANNIPTVVTEMEKAALELKVTPRIHMPPKPATDEVAAAMADPDIQLRVRASVTEIAGFISDPGIRVTSAQDSDLIKMPMLASREADTTVFMKSGQLLILGGLFRDEYQTRTKGVPVLEQVPWAGRLFQTSEDVKVRSEILILIRADVLDYNDDAYFGPLHQIPARVEQLRGTLEIEVEPARDDAAVEQVEGDVG